MYKFILSMFLLFSCNVWASNAGDEACKCDKPNTKHCETSCLQEGIKKGDEPAKVETSEVAKKEETGHKKKSKK